MTVEEKKIILKDYKNIADRVDSLNRQLARWRSVANNLSSSIKVGAKDTIIAEMEATRERIGAIELEMICNIKELSELDCRIKGAVSRLSNKTHQDIITIRYIECVSNWDIIADRIGYSQKQTLRLHGRALHEIDLST